MVQTAYFYTTALGKGFFLVGCRYLCVDVSYGLTVEILMWSSAGVAFHSKPFCLCVSQQSVLENRVLGIKTQ